MAAAAALSSNNSRGTSAAGPKERAHKTLSNELTDLQQEGEALNLMDVEFDNNTATRIVLASGHEQQSCWPAACYSVIRCVDVQNGYLATHAQVVLR